MAPATTIRRSDSRPAPACPGEQRAAEGVRRRDPAPRGWARAARRARTGILTGAGETVRVKL